ncbi:EamA family transporter [Hymenobacter busanensis]|uniref:EamA family transporter n=1 Tax=Hymenobacter busanensis TaxID=2607656 RepID=A0A7L4ZYG4_9BACT|nr:EamA family transporter [Hymenobacter busanensis]KAA9333246.1 EamA family transporter [Hymenobacter busanensis]QHJ08077.1 EamA family transporter [Hymenobacter busanensis]
MTSVSVPRPPALLVGGALLSIYLIWGSTYLASKTALTACPPMLLSGMRFLLAGAVQYGVVRLSGAAAPSRQDWQRAALAGFCLLLCGNGGTTFSQQYIPSGLAALLVASVPMFLALLSWVSGLTPRPTVPVTVGLLLGAVGMYLLASTRISGDVLIPGHVPLGIAAVLIASFMWSIGSLLSKQKPVGGSPFLGVGMQMLCGGAFLLLGALVRGEAASFQLANVTLKAGLAFGYLIVFGSWIAFSAYIWLLRMVEPALAGTYAFVNPVVAVLLGWAFAGEELNPQMASGATLIVLAVMLVVLGGRRSRPQPAAEATPEPHLAVKK